MEIGSIIPGQPGSGSRDVMLTESLGFDIATFGDTQHMVPDPFVRMGHAAAMTSTIKMATLVTPPSTRDAAVTASAITTVQAESNGRAILGLGSGYTALRYIGQRYPALFDDFSAYVRQVRAYLRHEKVDRNGFSSKLNWVPDDLPPVPLDVAATGPRGIGLAAEVADRVTFAVGAGPEELQRVRKIADQALAASGRRDAAEVRFGVRLVAAVHDDRAAAIAGVRSTVAGVAHFGGGAMKGIKVLVEPDIMHRARENAARELTERNVPARSGPAYVAAIEAALDDEFIDWYAVVGTGPEVLKRFQDLAAAGFSYVYIAFGGPSADPNFAIQSRERFAREVLPHVQ
jgi:5,10-methylenetetrahydromethanopterin reductase